MRLHREDSYQLHELSISLGATPRVGAWLVDDEANQVLSFEGDLHRLELVPGGLWTPPPQVESIALTPGSRDVKLEMRLEYHALAFECASLESEYRRSRIYEHWLALPEQTDPNEALPSHTHVRSLRANTSTRSVELELDAGDAVQVVHLANVVALDLDIESRNGNRFVDQVTTETLDLGTLSRIETAQRARPSRPGAPSPPVAMDRVRRTVLSGMDLKITLLHTI